MPNPDFGEVVAAFVVRKPGCTLTGADIIQRLKGEIAGFKVPKRVEFEDALPRNAMGKVQKAALREKLK
jgi:malonyl-CoA/methylmalonyl-CoA synthetase